MPALSAFFARYRKPLLLVGGLALFALLGLLLTNHFVDTRDSANIAAPITSAKHSAAALPFPSVSTDLAHKQIKFVTCLCRDKEGCVWIGTEDAGLWRYDPNASVAADYMHFAAADGPGDDTVYALACDKSGRIWAGTLNHGVAVFNGQKWGSYAPPDGPLGCHVTALAVNPVSGGVWMATEAGLARYEQKRWRYYTHADGLVSDHATALAFAPNGTLYVGTECDGLAIGSLHDDYKTWRTVSGPASPPKALRGVGLPSGMINCLDVTPNGEAWAGTTAGLAHSGDGGRTWQFRRGSDWKDKAFGRFTSGYADFAKVNAIEVIPSAGKAFAVRAFGPAAGRFLAARGFLGGNPSGTPLPVDTARVKHPAPQEVYRTERYGNFTFTASHLRPAASCRVRLHFTETFHNAPGQRIFDVSINGKRVLNHFDIFKAAGAENRAVIREFTTQADANGRLQIMFKGGTPGQDSSGLGEDYVTCLADDGAGHLLVGHRQQAPEAIDLRTGASLVLGQNAYINALLPASAGTALAGNYGDGLSPLLVKNLNAPSKFSPAPKTVAFLPVPPAPPDLAQLNKMLAEVSRVNADPQELQPHVAALDDDWRTQGDWLGRYGRYWATLAAFFHPIPEDYIWGAGWEPIDYKLTMGPSHSAGDSLRYWMQWRYTDNPRVLEMPAAYTSSRIQKHYTTWAQDRRETEVDDHGENYPPDMNGPNIYATLTVPEGLYYLSLYDFNKDGHDGDNRNRDYRLSVRVHSGMTLEDVRGFDAQPELAHGRIRDFWGGVWKRFLVRGPVTLTAEVNRNSSHNAILPAVMLDLVDEAPAPYFRTSAQWNAREEANDRERVFLARHPARFIPAQSEAQAASLLFDTLNEKRLINAVWWATEGRRCYAPLLRWYILQKPSKSAQTQRDLQLATCEYQMGCYPLWEKWQQAAGLTTARQIEKALRWDGVTNSYSGLGYQIVSVHQSEPMGRKVSQAH
jgi:hypothetical protein